jgi:phosphoribosylformylglycinamidine cyclo-ligase
VRVRIDRGTWTPPAVFDLVAGIGEVPPADLEATLNMGVGMVALVAPDSVDAALRELTERGLPAWVCGAAEATEPGAETRVVLDGQHPTG